jgi:hypothetical protein
VALRKWKQRPSLRRWAFSQSRQDPRHSKTSPNQEKSKQKIRYLPVDTDLKRTSIQPSQAKMLDPFIPPRRLVQALQPLSSLLYLKTFPLHAHEILLSWASYHVIQTTVAPLISKCLFPKAYSEWSRKTRINWDSRLVSLLQSSVISSAALYVIFNDRERSAMDWKGRIWGYTGAGGMVQGFAAGYFLWDIVVSVRYLDVFGPFTLAHALSAFCITMLGFVSLFFYSFPRAWKKADLN